MQMKPPEAFWSLQVVCNYVARWGSFWGRPTPLSNLNSVSHCFPHMPLTNYLSLLRRNYLRIIVVGASKNRSVKPLVTVLFCCLLFITSSQCLIKAKDACDSSSPSPSVHHLDYLCENGAEEFYGHYRKFRDYSGWAIYGRTISVTRYPSPQNFSVDKHHEFSWLCQLSLMTHYPPLCGKNCGAVSWNKAAMTVLIHTSPCHAISKSGQVVKSLGWWDSGQFVVRF